MPPDAASPLPARASALPGEIRRLQPADLDEVLAIEAAGYLHPWSREMFLRELEHDWSVFLVYAEPRADSRHGAAAGERRQRVLGFLLYWLVQDEIHLLNVAVAPDQRRRGIGRLLLAEMDKRARAADIALLTLEVRKGSTGARALYRELGYREAGIRKIYYAEEREDAVVMLRELRDRGF